MQSEVTMDEMTEEMITDVYDRVGQLNNSVSALVAAVAASKQKVEPEEAAPKKENKQLELPLGITSPRPVSLFDELCGGMTNEDFVTKLQAAFGITKDHPQWEEAAFRILYALEAHGLVKFSMNGNDQVVLWVDVGE